ncbi:MAG: prepilin-type N-terminal cleavage/methylation domain-containing protein, partial [Pseudomonadota bacterium]
MRPHASSPKQKACGFTLVEVLISLLIFSLIATSTIYTLRIGVTAREQLAQSDARLREFQALRLLLKDDLAQLLPRGTRDEFGNPLSRGFQGGQTAN